MKRNSIEIQRNNVTPAQFLAYVRQQLKKKNMRDMASDLDSKYFAGGYDLNFDYHNEPGKPCKAEKAVSKPYEMQTYILNWDGTCYNEICEFEFDDEKTGHGYYYLLNTIDNDDEEQTDDKERGNESMNLTPTQSLQAMYARRRMNREHAAPVPDFKKSRNYHQMKMIVQRQGGFREKDILRNPHIIEQGETWNDEHKVLNVLEAEPQSDGYRNGFAVDLVTMSICG